MRLRSPFLIFLFAAIVALAYQTAVFFQLEPGPVDDAYILHRYAQNLAVHGRLVWNLDGPPAAGATGWLQTVLYAAGLRVGIEPAGLGVALGLASQLLSLGLLWTCAWQTRGLARWVGLAAFLLAATAPFQFPHLVSGLETPLFGLLGLTGLVLFRQVLARRRPAHWAMLIGVLLLAAATRPEGMLLGLLMLGTAWTARRLPAWAAAAWAFGLTAYLAWHLASFGSLLPASVTVRAGQGTAGMQAGLDFFGLYLLLPAAAWGLLSSLRFQSPRSAGGLAGLCGMGLVLAGSLVSLGMRQEMNFSGRYFAPFYPLFLLSFIYMTPPRRPVHWAGPAALLAVLQLVLQLGGLSGTLQELRTGQAVLAQAHRPAALALADRLPAGSWVAAVRDPGLVCSLLIEHPCLDLSGLNDPTLAAGATPGETLDHLFSHAPAGMVVTSYDPERLTPGPSLAGLPGDPRLANYVLLGVFGPGGRTAYYQFVYLRADLAGEAGP